MKRAGQLAVGIFIAVILIWLLFRNTNWSVVADAIQGINVWWFLAAHIPLVASFFFRVQRWSYIVRASAPATFRQLFSATQIGFLANFALFGRIGEAVRALVLTRLTAIPFTKSLAMVALDRVADLIALMAVVIVTLFAYRPEGNVVIPAATFGTPGPITFDAGGYNALAITACFGLLVLIAGFVLLYVSQSFTVRITRKVIGTFSNKLAEIAGNVLNNFASGLHVFRSPAGLIKTIFFSLLTWGAGLLVVESLLRAFHIDAPWYTALFIQVLLSVFIAAPNTPGFVGQFHVPIVLSLVMLIPDVDPDRAKAVAIVIHLAQLPPIFLIGFYCLAREHMGLVQLTKESEELVEKQRETGETTP